MPRNLPWHGSGLGQQGRRNVQKKARDCIRFRMRVAFDGRTFHGWQKQRRPVIPATKSTNSRIAGKRRGREKASRGIGAKLKRAKVDEATGDVVDEYADEAIGAAACGKVAGANDVGGRNGPKNGLRIVEGVSCHLPEILLVRLVREVED